MVEKNSREEIQNRVIELTDAVLELAELVDSVGE